MTLSFAFFTYLNAFWIMLFFAAPFCVEYAKEGESPALEEKAYAAAPTSINWKKALRIAIVLAFLVTLALALLMKSGIVEVKGG